MIHHSRGATDIAEDEDERGFRACTWVVGGAKVVCEYYDRGEEE